MYFDIVKRTLRRHGRIFGLHAQDAFQYRLRSLVWMSVGLLSTITLVIFWRANLASNPGAYTQSFDQMLSYFLLMLLLGNVLISHTEMDVASSHIYRGELARYLLKPISYAWIVGNGEIVWRLMSGAWGLVFFALASGFGLRLTLTSDWRMILLAIGSCVLGHGISFLMTLCLGLSAIWLTSTKGLFELYEICLLFFAGYLLPLAVLPQPLQGIALATPFASIVYTPVTLLLGQATLPEAVRLLGLQLCWLLLFVLGYSLIWRLGVRKFTGVG